ncbi:MAG TPA: putative Ig domain-containing protein [Candidatus Acidoferrum sp.]|nr:putative Ig domain-containing protein [Candidatus Acidoferrum sp.]
MKRSKFNSLFLVAIAITLVVGSSGCSGGSAVPPPPPPPPAITVSLSPSSAQSVDQGQSIKFTATVTNDSSNKGVTWTLTQNNTACSPSCGTISPNSTASGAPATYTAPAAVNSKIQFSVTATSVADTSKSASDQTTDVPPPALNNPATLPAATVGQAYSYQLTEAGGVPPFTWSITSGSLPAGLSLNIATGLISGTPTVASQAVPASAKSPATSQPNVAPSSFTAQGCDSGSPQLCNSQILSMLVNQAPGFSLSASPTSVTIGQGGSGTSTITVNPTNGFNGSVSLTASNLPTGVTAAFSSPGATTTSTLTLTASGTATTGTVTMSVTGTSGNLPPQTVTVSLTVTTPKPLPTCSTLPSGTAGEPSITTQPTNQTVGVGQMATFSVTASNATSYQWYKNGNIISGATGPSYTTPATAGTDSGNEYTVVVSNSVCSLLSSPATLTVTPSNANDLTFSYPAPPPPTPPLNGITGTITLTQAGGQVFSVTSSASASAKIDWTLNCGPYASCGSVNPAQTTSGGSVTYLAPTGLPLAGETFTLIATRDDAQSDFATAQITVKPCGPGETMCGEITFLIQGFDAKGNPAAAAGSFTATGLANWNPTLNPPCCMITDGVIDINDGDGVDAAAQISSGSYTYDKDSTGTLLPNLNSLTGTITLNIKSTLAKPPASHTQRTYAFTQGAFLQGTLSLIEFEPIPSSPGGCSDPGAPPACGFQGSGLLSKGVPPGSYAFPTDVGGRPNCTANANPPTNCNYAFEFEGATRPLPPAVPEPIGMVGVFNVSVDATNACNVATIGTQSVIRNQPPLSLQGSLFGNCGTVASVNGVNVANDVNGRGTFQGCFICSSTTPPTDTLAYYVLPTGGLIFIDMGAGGTLSGLASPTGISSASPLGFLNCGTVTSEDNRVDNCVAYTSGGSQTGGPDVTLSLGLVTCATGAVCENPVSNNTLMGNLSVTLDQVTGGMCNGQMGSCGNSTTIPASYSIDATTGVGSICLHAAPCATFDAPPPSGAATALYYADGFLLANDYTAATGSLEAQYFFCIDPCSGPGGMPHPPSAFENNNPGPFVGATVPSYQSIVPNATGLFTLKAPAPDSTTPCTTATADNFDSDALYASGLDPSPFTQSVPPNSSVTGCFAFDNTTGFSNSGTSITGRGTGTSTTPGPADFVFYEITPGRLVVMETDDTIPGGQALLNLTSQSARLAITSASSIMACANGSTVTACTNGTIKPLNSFTITATGAPTPALSQAPVGNSPNLGTIGLTFTDNKNGTATITGTVNKDTGNRANCDSATNPAVCTYVFTITAQNVQGSATVSAKQTFVLDVIQ